MPANGFVLWAEPEAGQAQARALKPPPPDDELAALRLRDHDARMERSVPAGVARARRALRHPRRRRTPEHHRLPPLPPITPQDHPNPTSNPTNAPQPTDIKPKSALGSFSQFFRAREPTAPRTQRRTKLDQGRGYQIEVLRSRKRSGIARDPRTPRAVSKRAASWLHPGHRHPLGRPRRHHPHPPRRLLHQPQAGQRGRRPRWVTRENAVRGGRSTKSITCHSNFRRHLTHGRLFVDCVTNAERNIRHDEHEIALKLSMVLT